MFVQNLDSVFVIYGVNITFYVRVIIIWVKLFNNGQSKIFERQPLKNFTLFILEYLGPYNVMILSSVEAMVLHRLFIVSNCQYYVIQVIWL